MIVRADARRVPLADDSVQCVVTSPPYWGLRKYKGEQELVWTGTDGCEHEWGDMERLSSRIRNGEAGGLHDGRPTNGLVNTIMLNPIVRGSCEKCGAWRGAYGLEPTVEMYVAHTVEILREIRRVLRKDGVVFWNVGDSYAANRSYQVTDNKHVDVGNNHGMRVPEGLKPKDLCLIPMRVALAAQQDGWWIRSDIIWAKPNPMPESVKDRPTDAYEHILMMTRSERYFWDADAVREPLAESTLADGRNSTGRHTQGSETYGIDPTSPDSPSWYRSKTFVNPEAGRNLRNIWTFPTQPYKGAHFATFPERLPRVCIKAASRVGDLVLDPFGGSGTVGKVATELSRRFVLLDLAYTEDSYAPLARERIARSA